MIRFDSEAELETHELGRSLLLMLRDDDIGLHAPPLPLPLAATVNPFDAIRSRLAALDSAFVSLQAQVLPVVGYAAKFYRVCVLVLVLSNTMSSMTYLFVQLSFQWKYFFLDKLCRLHVGLLFPPLPYRLLSSSILCHCFWPALVLLLGLSADFHFGLHVCSPPHCL